MLAAEAGTTPRHLSFIESGRSRPGRELVLRLADALDLPIRERNTLLASAGLAAAYPAHDLDDPALDPVREVLERMVQRHDPYPAWVVARGLHFIASNRAAEALMPGLCERSPRAIVDMWFAPGPFREVVENWPDVIWAGVAALRREALQSNDRELRDVLRHAELQARHVPRPLTGTLPDFPVVCPVFRVDGQRIRTISTVMRFDTAVEVTTSELRVELMFPADDQGARFFQELASR